MKDKNLAGSNGAVMSSLGGSGRRDHVEVVAGYPLVAVAIDKNKGSQNAMKWAIDNLLFRGQIVTLIHVNVKGHPCNGTYKEPTDHQTKDIFLPFRCFCLRKDIQCKDVLLGGQDVAKAIVEFVSHAAIEKLVIGAPSKAGFVRKFKHHDIPVNITKGAPDFCSIYVISKGRISAMRDAVNAAPLDSPLRAQIRSDTSFMPESVRIRNLLDSKDAGVDGRDLYREDSVRSRGSAKTSPADLAPIDTDTASFGTADTDSSFDSPGRRSLNHALLPSISSGSQGIDHDFDDIMHKSIDPCAPENEPSSNSQGIDAVAVAEEMKRLRLELKHTMDMYNQACKEAITAKQKAVDLQHWKVEEEKKLNEAHIAEEAAMALVERERAKCRAAMEAAQAEHRIAELEAQKRVEAETKLVKEAEEKRRALESLAHTDMRYRHFTIEEIEAATESFAEHRKIGEGGYGPVYKCYLDHTAVAIKVLRPDATHGRSQFHQEVDVLSCIRHPNVVLLLGACLESGCLVYEYMANGSLDDRLFRRGNTPVIPWQYRFQIAAEIATGLLFLHHMKPEPLVHRDLKPGNILLDKNYVSKISDVGLARLVPSSVADSVTQCRLMTTAGTFCYIDPEYQQTGMLGVKSDTYSLGVVLLQILTAMSPKGLTPQLSSAIEEGTFAEMLDPEIPDWPLEEAQRLAEIALKCTELRRKDRPDLETIVLPELERLRDFAEDHMDYCKFPVPSHCHSPPFDSPTSHQETTRVNQQPLDEHQSSRENMEPSCSSCKSDLIGKVSLNS